MSTVLEIQGEKFLINGEPTYPGRACEGCPVEGLLFNMRAVQATFDDENWPQVRQYVVQDGTRSFAYPDTGQWDPDRNVDEFVAAMGDWRKAGVLALTVSFQGGRPLRPIDKLYMEMSDHPYVNTAFGPDGSLKPAHLARMGKILRRADELGMATIVSYFYFGQDGRLANEEAVIRGTDEATLWLLATGHRNIIVEVVNYADHRRIDHDILRPARVVELIERVKSARLNGRRLLATTAFNRLPTDEGIRCSDVLLMHANHQTPTKHQAMAAEVRSREAFRKAPKPLVFNEAGHQVDCLEAAWQSYASWGYFEAGENNYRDGYQSPPVNWRLQTPALRAFLERLSQITGGL